MDIPAKLHPHPTQSNTQLLPEPGERKNLGKKPMLALEIDMGLFGVPEFPGANMV